MGCITAIALFFSAAARAQDSRYVEYGFSFQPPAGWQEDAEAEGTIRVQYFGPQRGDGSQPRLNLSVQNYAINLSEQQINSLKTEMLANINELGMRDPKVISQGKSAIAGHDALQIDYSYSQDGAPTRLRQVYVPVLDHKRTYLFTFVDNAQHFDQSAGAVQAAINSFTTAAASASPATAASKPEREPGAWKWLLI
ncbi:MAG TPA: PsbP-related protein, partial [Blastocatellia bacterium]|nr:PsbP-related protein [Blastocatellia bacterium]